MAKEKDPKAEKEDKNPEKEFEVRIYSLATTANECIVFLEEVGGNRLLPIWIGLTEGQAIAIRFSGIVLPRPLTHDLLLSSIKLLDWTVTKIVVTDIKENTFYANIHLKKGDEERVLDARPSDAIAAAVRAGCLMYVTQRVFSRCQVLNKPISEDEVTSFKDQLSTLRPEDIYKDLKLPGKKGKDSRSKKENEPDAKREDEDE
ncbi:MAG: bifunctional nuclease family protein [Elusimicrobiota bacterium]